MNFESLTISMKFVIILLIILNQICGFLSRAVDNNFEFKRTDDGYYYRFGTKDSNRFETAVYTPDKKGDIHFEVSGLYDFTGADGRIYAVQYEADDKGFHPVFFIRPNATVQAQYFVGTLVIKTLGGAGLG